MTAAAVMPPPSAVPHFAARYKEPHEWAGIIVERGRECGCGRWFPQWAVAKKYRADLGGLHLVAEINCEIEQLKKGTLWWWPKRCHRCERRVLDTPQL